MQTLVIVLKLEARGVQIPVIVVNLEARVCKP